MAIATAQMPYNKKDNDGLIKATVIFDTVSYEWLQSQTSKIRNRSAVIRDLVFAEMDREEYDL